MNYLILFLTAFISATLFPLGSEALLLSLLYQDYSIILLLIFASTGNILGSIVNYYLGLKGEEYLENKKLITTAQISRYKKYFDQWGGYSLLLSWMPIIGDPLTFIAGILKYDFKKFLFFVSLAKFGRYLFLILIWENFV